MFEITYALFAVSTVTFMFSASKTIIRLIRITKHHHAMLEMNTQYIVKQIKNEIGEEEFERLSDLAFQEVHGDASIQVDDAINRILGRKGKNGLG